MPENAEFNTNRGSSDVVLQSALWAVALSVYWAGSTLGRAQEVEGLDVALLCNVYDFEMLDNVIAYQFVVNTQSPLQSMGHVYVGRLRPAPPVGNITVGTVFFEPPFFLDDSLPPLGQSQNGPEIGLDENEGVEVVYAKTDAANNWHHARQAILWPLWHPNWPNKWEEREFLNAEPIPPDVKDNRWYPFATQVGEQEAKVVYFHTPGPRSTNKRMAFRRLEEANLGLETIIGEDDPNAQAFGHWARIDDQDYVLSTYGPPGNTQVVLYDVLEADPEPIFLTDLPGTRSGHVIDFDPFTERYTLAFVKFAGGQTSIEVYQEVQPGVWQPQYEFTAAIAGDTSPNLAVSSPEFFTWQNRLYIAFVTADVPDFSSATSGNIWITRVDVDDANPGNNYYKRLNAADDPEHLRKRTEPEVHYPVNDMPVVFYSQEAADGDGSECEEGVNTLRRVRTYPLPPPN